MAEPGIILFGRFPPPVDGQSLTTERFENLISDDFNVIRVDSSILADEPFLVKMRHYFRVGRKLREALTNNPGAVVVWQSISPQVSGHFRDLLTVFPHIRNRATVAVVHWGDFDRAFRSPLTRWTASRLAKSIDRFVFLDEELSEACSLWIRGSKRSVLSNSVDSETLCSESDVEQKRKGDLKTGLRILYLSNMIESKGYLDVVRAASLLKDKEIPVKFSFVGNWYSEEARHAFENLVQTEGIEDIVEHHGPVYDRSVVKQLHLAAHVFVLPSYYPTEAQPVSIIEAMAAGTPVISTYHGGIPSMVKDGESAFLVPVQSPQAIADAIGRLADHATWHEMSLHARKRFLEKYHPDTIRRQWLDLVSSVGEHASLAE